MTGHLWIPDNSEIIRFNADDGTKSDCIRIGGRMIQPCIDFLQFYSKEMMKEKFGENSLCENGWWIGVDDEFQNQNLLPFQQSWYFEEVPKEIELEE